MKLSSPVSTQVPPFWQLFRSQGRTLVHSVTPTPEVAPPMRSIEEERGKGRVRTSLMQPAKPTVILSWEGSVVMLGAPPIKRGSPSCRLVNVPGEVPLSGSELSTVSCPFLPLRDASIVCQSPNDSGVGLTIVAGPKPRLYQNSTRPDRIRSAM